VSASSTLAYWLFVPEKAFAVDGPAVEDPEGIASTLYTGKYQLFGQTLLTKVVN
jgi:hypothetical protein